MSNDPGDVLITYNPDFFDEYIDSSDFEEPSESNGLNRKPSRRKEVRNKIMENDIKRKMYCVKSVEKKHLDSYNRPEYTWNEYNSHNRHCNSKNCQPRSEGRCCYQDSCKRKYKHEENDTNNFNIQTASRPSLVRTKVMPCFSNIFCRSNNKCTTQVEENHSTKITKDNSCQVYSVHCGHRRMRKSSTKSNKTGQTNTFSLCSSDDDIDKVPVRLEPRTRDSNISCNFSSSSSVMGAKNKFKRVIERELMKYNLKKQYIKRNREQQYPSKPNFQVYSATETNDKKLRSDIPDKTHFGCNVMPSNSSVFWEYLVDRIHKKYQNNNKVGAQKSCNCVSSQQCPSMEAGLQALQPEKVVKTQGHSIQNSIVMNCTCKSSSLDKQLPGSAGTGLKFDQKIQTSKQDSLSRVTCKCPGAVPALPPTHGGPGAPATKTPGAEVTKPCQEPHDEIKASLQQKYNGEILCIHNPPCILINGCLNLPPVKRPFSPSAWPVTGDTSFNGRCTTEKVTKIDEQACQYKSPSLEFIEYQIENKYEKMTQSICNHDPPCEVVRGCYKPNFDPQLENSCVHVPMCLKMPECLLSDSSNEARQCEHQPKCPEMPVCKDKSNRYTVLTAKDEVPVKDVGKDNVGTQAKVLSKLECRHEPHCIMIPRCLGRLMSDGYVPYDAIPGCNHQPTCDLIPACCRKSAKMSRLFKITGLRRRSRRSTATE